MSEGVTPCLLRYYCHGPDINFLSAPLVPVLLSALQSHTLLGFLGFTWDGQGCRSTRAIAETFCSFLRAKGLISSLQVGV